MPADMFLELSEEKRNKIINVTIVEFSKYGYENGSTNRIVQNAHISKGSLFKYFKNKDELYFYILDLIVQELTISLEQEIPMLPGGLFERIIKYSELEFAWYMKHPEKCRLITAAFTRSNTAIYQKVEARYHLKAQDIYVKLLEDMDISILGKDKEKSLNILKWFLKGFNDDFRAHTEIQADTNIRTIQQNYVKSLTDYLGILKYGLINGKSEG